MDLTTKLFQMLKLHGVPSDIRSVQHLIKSLGASNNCEDSMFALNAIKGDTVANNIFIDKHNIDLLGSGMDDERQMIEEVHYSTAITACYRHGKHFMALKILQAMQLHNLTPNDGALQGIIFAYCKLATNAADNEFKDANKNNNNRAQEPRTHQHQGPPHRLAHQSPHRTLHDQIPPLPPNETPLLRRNRLRLVRNVPGGPRHPPHNTPRRPHGEETRPRLRPATDGPTPAVRPTGLGAGGAQQPPLLVAQVERAWRPGGYRPRLRRRDSAPRGGAHGRGGRDSLDGGGARRGARGGRRDGRGCGSRWGTGVPPQPQGRYEGGRLAVPHGRGVQIGALEGVRRNAPVHPTVRRTDAPALRRTRW